MEPADRDAGGGRPRLHGDADRRGGQPERSLGRVGVTVDTTAAAPTLALAADSGTSSIDGITNDGTVNVSGLEAGATWEYSTDGGTNWAAGSGTSFTLIGDGAKDVIVRQTDTAGNTSDPSSLGFTLDTTAPTIAISAVTGDNTINEAEATAGFNVSGTTDAEDGQTVTVHIVDAGSSEVIASITTTVSAGTWSVNVPAGAIHGHGDGGYTVTADVSDAAGNPATQASQSLTLKETAPRRRSRRSRRMARAASMPARPRTARRWW